MDLGARPWQVFWLVTLPMIAQALLSALLLTFTLSLDDVVLSAFLSGPGATTMPLVIFSRARLGLNPSVNAVATMIIAGWSRSASSRRARASRATSAGARPRGSGGRARSRPAAAQRLMCSSSLAYLTLGRLRLLRPAWRSSARYVGFSKTLVVVFPVFLLAWLRFAIAAVAMAAVAAAPRRTRRRWTSRTHALLFLESFFGNFLFSICMLFGVCAELGARSRRDHGGDAGGGRDPVARLPAASASARASCVGIACAIGGIALVSLRHASGRGRAAAPRRCSATCCCSAPCAARRPTSSSARGSPAPLGPKRISALINLWGLALMMPLGAVAGRGIRFRRRRRRRRGCCCWLFDRRQHGDRLAVDDRSEARAGRRPASSPCCCRSAPRSSASCFSASASAPRRRLPSGLRWPASCSRHGRPWRRSRCLGRSRAGGLSAADRIRESEYLAARSSFTAPARPTSRRPAGTSRRATWACSSRASVETSR